MQKFGRFSVSSKRSFPDVLRSHYLVLSSNELGKNRCRTPRAKPSSPRRHFDGFFPSRSARDLRTAHDAGRLTEVRRLPPGARGTIWRKFPSYLQRPYFEKMCRTFSRKGVWPEKPSKHETSKENILSTSARISSFSCQVIRNLVPKSGRAPTARKSSRHRGFGSDDKSFLLAGV